VSTPIRFYAFTNIYDCFIALCGTRSQISGQRYNGRYTYYYYLIKIKIRTTPVKYDYTYVQLKKYVNTMHVLCIPIKLELIAE
jgi:hypothetical protein